MELRKVRKAAAKKRHLDGSSSDLESEPEIKIDKKEDCDTPEKKNKVRKSSDGVIDIEKELEERQIEDEMADDDEDSEEVENGEMSEKNNLTLEQFTDIVLASEGLSVAKKKEQEEANKRAAVKKPVFLEPIPVKEENNNKAVQKDKSKDVIENNHATISGVAKPVVLSPRQPPGSHLLPHFRRSEKISLGNSVVVSVKPRIQCKSPSPQPPENNTPKTPQVVEEWLNKIHKEVMATGGTTTENNSDQGALNLSKKAPTTTSVSSLSPNSVKSTPVYLQPINSSPNANRFSPLSDGIPTKDEKVLISAMNSTKLWPPGHPKSKALLGLEAGLKEQKPPPKLKYSPELKKKIIDTTKMAVSAPILSKIMTPAAAALQRQQQQAQQASLEALGGGRLDPPVISPQRSSKILLNATHVDDTVHLETVRARALRDVQLAHSRDLHGN